MSGIDIDHAQVIAFLTMIWDLLNYGNILYYVHWLVCLFLCYLVFKHLGDDDREISTVESDPELNV